MSYVWGTISPLLFILLNSLSNTFNPRYYTVGIISELFVKDSDKRLSSMEKPQYCMLQLTKSHNYRYVRVTERYAETFHTKKMADLVVVSS